MPRARRSEVVDADEVGVYHCYNQITQQARLFGVDPVTGVDHSHRKPWIERALRRLAAFMGIEIIDFGILDNHFHVLLRTRPDVVREMKSKEIASRWCHLCPTAGLTRGEARKRPPGRRKPTAEQIARIVARPDLVEEYRKRLADVSWFMRLLCKPIADRANRESGKTGPFFAGRFKCKRVEDDAALLTCSMYINLNTIRAGVDIVPETARFTSAFRRIRALRKRQLRGEDQSAELNPRPTDADAWLVPVFLNPRADAYTSVGANEHREPTVPCQSSATADREPAGSTDRLAAEAAEGDQVRGRFARRLTNKGFLPMTVEDYLKLLDWTGRQQRSDGPAGSIPSDLAPILERLGVRPSSWLSAVEDGDQYHPTSFGRRSTMEARANARGRRALRGIGRSDINFT